MSYFPQLTSGFGIHLVDKAKYPFEQFEDWLKDGPAGKWSINGDDKFTLDQQSIVSKNAKLLGNKVAWEERVEAFETAMNSLDEKDRDEVRKKYIISFQSKTISQIMPDDRVLKFPCDVTFRNSTIVNNADFKNLVVQGDATFRNANFGGDACFNFAEINGNLIMDNAKIAGNALFRSTTDDNNIEASNPVKIRGGASFNHLNLKGNLDLSDAEICRKFSLQDAKIGGDVQFWRARLRNDVNLERTKIEGNFQFEYVDMNRRPNQQNELKFFADDMSVDGVIAIKTRFPDEMNMARLMSKGPASFSGSTFERIPDFSDAKFERPPEVAGILVPLPVMKTEKQWFFTQAADPKDVVKLRKLKAMAVQANDHEKDGEFFAKEMLAKRGFETKNFLGLMFNTIYWKLSDFGQSFVRPLVGLFFSWSIFPILYLVAVLWGQLRYPNSDEVYLALQLSMRNFLPFFGSLFRFSPRPKEHNSAFMNTYHDLVNKGLDADWLVAIGIVQNIIGAVLLFLFLLALRNKFRLK